jgi:hydrogenase expression/formation protein HypC
MCLSIPGKVIEIEKDKFMIDYGSEKRQAIMSVVEDLKIGDYVIISNKIIISIIPKNQAIKYLEIVGNVRKENGRKL